MFNSVVFNVDVVIFRVVSDLRLASFAFGFKPSQLKGVLETQLEEGLQIILSPHWLVRLVSWLRLLLAVVKLSVDDCSRGNPDMSVAYGVLRDHRRVAMATFNSFLGHQLILFTKLTTVLEGLDLARFFCC